MKKLKLHTIISGILLLTSNMHMQAMEQITNTWSTVRSLAVAANLGIQRQLYGHALELENELKLELSGANQQQTNVQQCTQGDLAKLLVSKANKVNRALTAIENDPERAMKLVMQLNTYNHLNPNTPYEISDIAKNSVKRAIEEYYHKNEVAAQDELGAELEALLLQYKRKYQGILAKSRQQEEHLSQMAKIVVLVGGKKPDSNGLAQTLAQKRLLPTNLHELIQAEDQDEYAIIVSEASSTQSTKTGNELNTKNPLPTTQTGNNTDTPITNTPANTNADNTNNNSSTQAPLYTIEELERNALLKQQNIQVGAKKKNTDNDEDDTVVVLEQEEIDESNKTEKSGDTIKTQVENSTNTNTSNQSNNSAKKTGKNKNR